MGHNDHLDDGRPELPPEAGENSRRGFVPNEEWLTTAPPELQRESMLSWFYSRYCDPADDTPYIGSEQEQRGQVFRFA